MDHVDTATVLETFVTDTISNLPAEVEHLLQEMKIKDGKLHELHRKVLQRDSQIQKHIKQHGALVDNPKEAQYSPKIQADYQRILKLQDEKCELAEQLYILMKKHMSRLNSDIDRLKKEGLILPTDGAVTPQASANRTPSGAVSRTASLAPTLEKLHHHHNSTTINGGSRLGRSPSVLSATPVSEPSRPLGRGQSLTSPAGRHGSSRASTPNVVVEAGDIQSGAEYGLASDTPQQHRPHKRQRPDRPLIPGSVSLDFKRHGSKGKGMGATMRGADKGGDNDDEENNDTTLYCFCQQVSYGDMVACDNPDCQYEWFHYGCVGLKQPPSGVWYCSACTQLRERKLATQK